MFPIKHNLSPPFRLCRHNGLFLVNVTYIMSTEHGLVVVDTSAGLFGTGYQVMIRFTDPVFSLLTCSQTHQYSAVLSEQDHNYQ